jgi:hypothetical protein
LNDESFAQVSEGLPRIFQGTTDVLVIEEQPPPDVQARHG